jgi:hypothetical protein
MTRYIPVILALFLTGCVEAGARIVEDASYLHQAGRAYVMEVHILRQDIRRLCRDMLMAEVKLLEQEGRTDEARARLRDNYPGLVTLDIAKQARADPEGIMSEPFGCQ